MAIDSSSMFTSAIEIPFAPINKLSQALLHFEGLAALIGSGILSATPHFYRDLVDEAGTTMSRVAVYDLSRVPGSPIAYIQTLAAKDQSN